MKLSQIKDALEDFPIIAATDTKDWEYAVTSDSKVLFHLKAEINTVKDDIKLAKDNGKIVFVHIDLTEGIGKDKWGLKWLLDLGVDGIISTRSQMIRYAKELGLLAIQRFFVLDSKGMHSIRDTLSVSAPDLIEIMPGVIPKAIKLFESFETPVIAGGLIENSQEAVEAIKSGALAVSTGSKNLWKE